jgi:thioesterase domain-containing protein/acyl carrier protein
VTVLASLPRTPNGKLDRTALPEPVRRSAGPAAPIAGLTEAEAAIAGIWSDVLAVEVTRADANFFELGGHSLLAARMFARIAARFGEKVPLAALFRSPVLADFARLVERHRAARDPDRVVWVQPLGSATPVIALHNTGIFHTLAGRIGGERPFMAVQIADPDVPSALPEVSSQDLVAAFVRMIRATRPHGPYILLGLCVAGTIAFEAAQQLRAKGEDVELLVLIDGWAPGYMQRRGWLEARLADLSHRVQAFVRQLARVRRGELSLLAMASRLRLVRALRVLPLARALGLVGEIPGDPPDQWMLDYYARALRGYRPRRYDGSVLLFRSPEQPSGWFLDPDMGWRELCSGPFACVTVPGDHLGMFQDPGASMMAERIRAAIAAATGGRP